MVRFVVMGLLITYAFIYELNLCYSKTKYDDTAVWIIFGHKSKNAILQ